MTLPNICPTGYYCGSARTITPDSCPVGTFSYKEGVEAQADCMPCPYGKYCTWNALGEPITSTADATECPDGFSCYDVTSPGLSITEMNAEH